MPRQARLDAPGTLHHVMIRGIEGSKIFQDDQDREAFVLRLTFPKKKRSLVSLMGENQHDKFTN